MHIRIDIVLTGLCIGVLVSGREILFQPSLSVSPVHPYYYEGETVTLTCATEREYRHANFTFYKDSKYIRTDNKYIYKIYGLDYSDVGNYACGFWFGSYSSPRSNEILLLLTDRSPAPVISLNRSLSVYSIGESVTIVCSPPKSLKARRIQFYKEGNVKPLKEAEENTCVIFISNKEVAGRYSCTYTSTIQEIDITSSPSEYIMVKVSDTSLPPVISLNPSLSVYSKGESVTIVCSPPRSMKIKRIQFYKEGNIEPLKETEEYTGTYMILTSKEVAGRYSCTYTLKIEDRWITSLSSQYIIVNVSGTARTAAATIIPETPELDMTSKTRNMETFSPNDTNSTNSANSGFWKILIYIFTGCLLLIMTIVLIETLLRIYIPRKGKGGDTMAELPVSESDFHSGHNLKTFEQTSLCPTSLQEMNTGHYYSEIELPIVKTPLAVKSSYATVTAIEPLPPVYQTDWTTIQEMNAL